MFFFLYFPVKYQKFGMSFKELNLPLADMLLPQKISITMHCEKLPIQYTEIFAAVYWRKIIKISIFLLKTAKAVLTSNINPLCFGSQIRKVGIPLA